MMVNKLIYKHIIIIINVLLLFGCNSSKTPTKPFFMRLDGSKYVWEPGVTLGYVSDTYDDLGPHPGIITVLFPLQKNSGLPLPGLELQLDVDSIVTGQELSFGDSLSVRCFKASFRPPHRPTTKEGLLVAYSSEEYGGYGRIVIDEMDARYRGRISGTLIYAKLLGFYYDPESGDIKTAQKKTVIEFFNWPFSAILDKDPYN